MRHLRLGAVAAMLVILAAGMATEGQALLGPEAMIHCRGRSAP